MSTDGTFVRAYVEADITGAFTNSFHYPGFAHASEKSIDDDVPPIQSYHPPAAGFFLGLMRIRSISEETAEATICNFNDGKEPNGIPMYLRYHRTGSLPPAYQHGPANQPSTDVFGGWQATMLGYDIRDADDDLCRNALATHPLPTGTAPLPPSPGWPQHP
jgi:hypothetical protein